MPQQIWNQAASISHRASPGNLIVEPFGLSFRFPTLRPPSSATGGGGLRSQPSTMYARRLEMIWSMIIISSHKRKQITSAPPGVFPWLFCVHWTPPGENLAKYNVHVGWKQPGQPGLYQAQKEINPTFVGLISFWNPATSYSPGSSPTKYHRR